MVTGLQSRSGYYIAMRVLNRAGWSDLSPNLEIIAGRLPSSPPQAPALTQSAATSIAFSWLPTSDIGGASMILSYNIYSGSSIIASVSPQTLSYIYTTVTAG